ncbi:TIGR03560 family F420-dependent LLM class oxidoreductase [Nocardia bovistercoris]|uniref:TIGR03560 family F420-dependent LLM class oxidoreductase n=1 Tax=Nocardia bovistercoris TaxID=2785916 RepID=A0A931I5Y4_9NOCA|nr:TIGR03560 family F420-dependent LLM class oxidoreductase [Nocardia bovistercoris]MBH0775469.1 TIGR03560 family F420-dependent LLM class oxidoreductase [Nocardia bovistercoris]
MPQPIGRSIVRLGYQIPDFNYGGAVAEIFPTVIAQAREAERAGFDTVFLTDHFYQRFGPPHGPTLEAYTALGGLAAATATVKLSTLVTGNTYRNPALLAKMITTLDVMSGGRAVLGLGAGWLELEHKSYGFEFGSVSDRFDRLDEALRIIRPMLQGSRPSLDGTWYRVENAINEPRVRDDLPIMLGGAGEKKTFALAARHADHLSIGCDAVDLPRKLDALRQRCEEIGRDRATLDVSYLAFVAIAETSELAHRTVDEMFATRVKDPARAEQVRASMAGKLFIGDPEEVADQLRDRILRHGVDGLIVNMVANGHEPGVLELAGKALGPLLKP